MKVTVDGITVEGDINEVRQFLKEFPTETVLANINPRYRNSDIYIPPVFHGAIMDEISKEVGSIDAIKELCKISGRTEEDIIEELRKNRTMGKEEIFTKYCEGLSNMNAENTTEIRDISDTISIDEHTSTYIENQEGERVQFTAGTLIEVLKKYPDTMLVFIKQEGFEKVKQARTIEVLQTSPNSLSIILS